MNSLALGVGGARSPPPAPLAPHLSSEPPRPSTRPSPVSAPGTIAAPMDAGLEGDNLIVNYLPPAMQEHDLRVRRGAARAL